MKAEATSIYDYFGEVYTSFQKSGVQNPLSETQNLFDLLSGGMSTSIDVRTLEHGNVNFINDLVKKRTEKIPLEYIIVRPVLWDAYSVVTRGLLFQKNKRKYYVKLRLNISRERRSS
jgi:hypothetical protein